jgi:hypothetical protein
VSEPDCYSLRRVNPFLGVAAVVKTADARALSIDGRRWQLQVLAQPPRGLWSGDGYRDLLQYFRFGLWSEGEGLTRVLLNPILDAHRMVEAAQFLIAYIRECQSRLPFPLLPELEHWLLDQEGLPLALLATAIDGSDLTALDASEWSAGGRGERPFISAALARRGLPVRDASGRFHHAEALERQVQAAAGGRLNRKWFRRSPDGTGTELAPGAPEDSAGRSRPSADFPQMPLRTHWADEDAGALVADYIEWLAPFLLTLPGLAVDLRRSLERQAARAAVLVDSLWRLYPRILDEGLLNQVRVEAKLRRTG